MPLVALVGRAAGHAAIASARGRWRRPGDREREVREFHARAARGHANVIADRISPTNTNSMVHRKLVIPSELTLAIRWDTGISAALAGLRATAPWNAIREEHAYGAPPATTLGGLHAKYLQHDRARR